MEQVTCVVVTCRKEAGPKTKEGQRRLEASAGAGAVRASATTMSGIDRNAARQCRPSPALVTEGTLMRGACTRCGRSGWRRSSPGKFATVRQSSSSGADEAPPERPDPHSGLAVARYSNGAVRVRSPSVHKIVVPSGPKRKDSGSALRESTARRLLVPIAWSS